MLARVRAEVATAAGPDGRLEPERVVALPYLDATIKESLRVYPIVPAALRKAKRAMKVGGTPCPRRSGPSAFSSARSMRDALEAARWLGLDD